MIVKITRVACEKRTCTFSCRCQYHKYGAQMMYHVQCEENMMWS
jgi:hypothetical protein